MGWASGSRLFSDVWQAVREHIPKKSRVEVAKDVMRCFENEDCDTLMECIDDEWPEIEQAYEELNPD